METAVTLLAQCGTEFVPHIYRLPIELLQHLLSLAVAEIRHGNEPWRVYSRIVELRLVSTRWLAIIDSRPSFWTLLTNRLSPSLVSIVLEKSGKLPLDVDLRHSIRNSVIHSPLHYMNIVTRLAERWRSLNIRWRDTEQEEALRNLLVTPAPQLKAASFECRSDILRTVSLFDNMAPDSDLDSISTKFGLPNWNWFLMKGLRKIAIRAVLADVRDFEGLVRVLVASPNLEELEAHEWRVIGGTPPGEPSRELEPIALDSLRLFAVCNFPSPWAYKLLEAVRIPQQCNVDIALTNPSPQAPLSKLLKDLQARLTGSSSLKVELEARTTVSRAEYKCHGTDGVGDTSISLAAKGLRLSEASQFWLGSLAEITESVQTSGIPAHISILINILESPDTVTSTLKAADELLPSVYKASFAGWYTEQFLSYASSPSFPNLSDLEVGGVRLTLWREILECVSARSELATAQGWKFKPLRSISLPRRPIDGEIHERLTGLVESIVYQN